MWFDHLTRDLRQAVRQMKNRPGFSAIVILTLALGIGANSAIFSVVQAVLLRPLPYRDPSRLAMVFAGDPARELREGRTSLLNFADWKSQNRSFEDMTVFIGQTFLLGTDGSPERMRSARVPANFWTLLGVRRCSAACSLRKKRSNKKGCASLVTSCGSNNSEDRRKYSGLTL